ncbi:hypothetical protein BH92_07815 [Rhodococcoides fascians A21d2]|uniref:ApeA N-terminal domain 1-containing protein n=1 Tax=Nocardiaceae TaxID=85025 RepID=UPI000AC4F257|nr:MULTISPECIES: hypothetical protein [Rhodococcus]QIH99784.1 hypothetical protein BH92_07815 [Rhodococcus fascians A21d2]
MSDNDTDPQPLRGTFWLASDSLNSVRASLQYRDGTEALLTVDGQITPGRSQLRHTTGSSATTIRAPHPDDAVADFEPVTVHGTLEDGTALTLLDTRIMSSPLWPPRSPQQRATVQTTVRGAHLTGPEHQFHSIRFSVDIPGGWDHLAADSSGKYAVAEGISFTVIEDTAGRLLFEYVSSSPRSLLELRMSASNAIAGLVQLCTRREPRVSSISVSADVDGPLLAVKLTEERDTESRPMRTFIPLEALTVEVLVHWLSVWQKIGNLGDAVIAGRDDVVEANVLVLCAVAEGLDNRLFGDTNEQLVLTEGQRKTIRRSARSAGLRAFDDLGTPAARADIERSLTDSLAGFGRMTFSDRMNRLATKAATTAPGIISDFSESDIAPHESWQDLVTFARNTMAHQISRFVGNRHRDRHYRLLISVSMSLDWVLKILLLNESGIHPLIVERSVISDAEFQYYRANIRSTLNC